MVSSRSATKDVDVLHYLAATVRRLDRILATLQGPKPICLFHELGLDEEDAPSARFREKLDVLPAFGARSAAVHFRAIVDDVYGGVILDDDELVVASTLRAGAPPFPDCWSAGEDVPVVKRVVEPKLTSIAKTIEAPHVQPVDKVVVEYTVAPAAQVQPSAGAGPGILGVDASAHTTFLGGVDYLRTRRPGSRDFIRKETPADDDHDSSHLDGIKEVKNTNVTCEEMSFPSSQAAHTDELFLSCQLGQDVCNSSEGVLQETPADDDDQDVSHLHGFKEANNTNDTKASSAANSFLAGGERGADTVLKASLDDPWLSVPITLASSSEEERAVDDFSDQAGCSDGRASPFAHAATSDGTLQQKLQGQVLPETLPGAQGSVVLPTLCPMCRSRVISDDELYDSIRSRGLTGDDYCVDVGESSALAPVCCYGCPARAHNRCLGTSRESARSIDYLHYSSGWYSDPEGWLCPACAPAETRKEKKKKVKAKRGRQ